MPSCKNDQWQWHMISRYELLPLFAFEVKVKGQWSVAIVLRGVHLFVRLRRICTCVSVLMATEAPAANIQPRHPTTTQKQSGRFSTMHRDCRPPTSPSLTWAPVVAWDIRWLPTTTGNSGCSGVTHMKINA